MKKSNYISAIVFIALVIVLFPSRNVYADAGPKLFPFTFDFHYDSKNNTIASGILLACKDVECQTPIASSELWCFPMQCVSYFEPPKAPYYKIKINFSDKTRVSNVFSQVRLSAIYDVEVREDGLEVKEIFNSGFSSLLVLFFVPALLITVITEKIIAGIFSKKWNVRLRWIGRINIVSLAIVWYIFPTLPIPLKLVWTFAEIFVIIFETLLITFANKTLNISITQFLTLSTVANLASILVGIAIPIVLLFFLWINQECINSTRCNVNDYFRWVSEFISLAEYVN